IRDLYENAGAVSHQRIGSNGATMGQIFEHFQRIVDNLACLLRLDVCDQADAAGVVLVARVVEALLARIGGDGAGHGWRRGSFRHLVSPLSIAVGKRRNDVAVFLPTIDLYKPVLCHPAGEWPAHRAAAIMRPGRSLSRLFGSIITPEPWRRDGK